MTDPSRRDRSRDGGATDPADAPDHPGDPSDDGPVSHEVELAPDEVARHWTDERRRQAAPRDQRRSPPEGGGTGPQDDRPPGDASTDR